MAVRLHYYSVGDIWWDHAGIYIVVIGPVSEVSNKYSHGLFMDKIVLLVVASAGLLICGFTPIMAQH